MHLNETYQYKQNISCSAISQKREQTVNVEYIKNPTLNNRSMQIINPNESKSSNGGGVLEKIIEESPESTSENTINKMQDNKKIKFLAEDKNESLTQNDLNNISSDSQFREQILNVLQNSIRGEILNQLCATSLKNLLNKTYLKKILNELHLGEFTKDNELIGKKKKRAERAIDSCEHVNAKHYAKGMCYNCYHREGRTKSPWACEHKTRPLYALGKCHNCYQNMHNKNRAKEEKRSGK